MSADSTSERIFVSRYRPGVIFAPKPGFLIAPLIFIPGIGVFKSALMAGLIALLAVAGASMYWTAKRKREPALVLSAAGMAIEGMKLTPWANIGGVDRTTDAKGYPALVLKFTRKTPQINASPLWKIAGPNAVLINVSLLADQFEDIEAAFEHFIRP